MPFKAIFAAALLALLRTPATADEIAPAVSSATVENSTNTPTASWRKIENTAFQAGEHLTFVVKWGIITGGRSSLVVSELARVDGRLAYHIVSEAASSGVVDAIFKVRDRNESWLDADSLLTVRYQKNIREGKFRIEETGVLDQVLQRYQIQSYRKDKDKHETKEGALPKPVVDVLGSLYFVRTLPMEVGASHAIDVFNNGKLWPLIVHVKKRESVRVPAGKFDCFRVEPVLREPGIFVAKGKKLEVWLTADERRLPVKMRSEVAIGHVSAELTEIRRAPGEVRAP